MCFFATKSLGGRENGSFRWVDLIIMMNFMILFFSQYDD